MDTTPSSINNHCHRFTATKTKRNQSSLGISSSHFMQNRNKQSSTAGTNRMAQGDGATVDIDFGRIKLQHLIDCYRGATECLVYLKQINYRPERPLLFSKLLE